MARANGSKKGFDDGTTLSMTGISEGAHKRTPSQLTRLSAMLKLGHDQPKADARIEPTVADEEMESTPYLTAVMTYLGYLVLILVGHLRDFFGKRFRPKEYEHLREQNVLLNDLICRDMHR